MERVICEAAAKIVGNTMVFMTELNVKTIHKSVL
jgi:hypothetical protein